MRIYLVAIYAASLAFHAGLAVVLASIEPPAIVETVRIQMRDAPPVEEPPHDEPPPPPPEPEAPPPPVAEAPPPPPPRPRAEPPPPVAQPAPVPMMGAAMQGGVNTGGIPIPAGDPSAPPPQPIVRREERTLEAPPPAHEEQPSGCAEEATRPRPISMPQPAYTDDARTALIEGRVRVRIEVDSSGAVSNVEVLEGLGHGLDEAAIEAVRGARFEPATQCGEAVAATFTIAVRFTL